MRRAIPLSLLAIALLFVVPAPSEAWSRGSGGRGGSHGHWGGGHGRVFIGVAPGFWWGAPYPWYYPYYGGYYPAPNYGYAPPPVEEPPVSAQTAPAPQPQEYWYYCPSAQAYYPSAPTCPEVWVKVPPRPE